MATYKNGYMFLTLKEATDLIECNEEAINIIIDNIDGLVTATGYKLVKAFNLEYNHTALTYGVIQFIKNNNLKNKNAFELKAFKYNKIKNIKGVNNENNIKFK